MRSSDAVTGNAVSSFGRGKAEEEEEGKAGSTSRKDGNQSMCSASNCYTSPTAVEKNDAKACTLPKGKGYKLKRRHRKGKVDATTTVAEEDEEEVLLGVLNDILQ